MKSVLFQYCVAVFFVASAFGQNHDVFPNGNVGPGDRLGSREGHMLGSMPDGPTGHVLTYGDEAGQCWRLSLTASESLHLTDLDLDGDRVLVSGSFSGVFNGGGLELFSESVAGFSACLDLNGHLLWGMVVSCEVPVVDLKLEAHGEAWFLKGEAAGNGFWSWIPKEPVDGERQRLNLNGVDDLTLETIFVVPAEDSFDENWITEGGGVASNPQGGSGSTTTTEGTTTGDQTRGTTTEEG